MNIKNKASELFSKLEGWHKNMAIIISIIVATNFLTPYIQEIYKFFENSYNVQKDYEEMKGRLENLEEYVVVLNYVVDGVAQTRYHRGVRYLLTKGIKERPDSYKMLKEEEKLRWDLSHCDWYYLVQDSDGIKKWLRANYSAELDSFTYIDHSGIYHKIKTLKPSTILKDY